jgi:phosphoribosylamine--glycine ligase
VYKRQTLGDAKRAENVFLYHAGTKLEQNRLVTSGGRVLGVTAVGTDASAARNAAYEAAERIRFERAYYRRDIGARAIATVEQEER